MNWRYQQLWCKRKKKKNNNKTVFPPLSFTVPERKDNKRVVYHHYDVCSFIRGIVALVKLIICNYCLGGSHPLRGSPGGCAASRQGQQLRQPARCTTSAAATAAQHHKQTLTRWVGTAPWWRHPRTKMQLLFFLHFPQRSIFPGDCSVLLPSPSPCVQRVGSSWHSARPGQLAATAPAPPPFLGCHLIWPQQQQPPAANIKQSVG